MAGVNWRGLARRDISLCCFSMMVFCGGRSLSICDSNLNLERTSHQNMANPIFPVQLFQVESEKAPNFLGMVNQILLSLFSMKFIVSYSEGVFLLDSSCFPRFSPPPIEPLTDVGRCPSHMPLERFTMTRLIWFEKKH